jgi:hypothetical protein
MSAPSEIFSRTHHASTHSHGKVSLHSRDLSRLGGSIPLDYGQPQAWRSLRREGPAVVQPPAAQIPQRLCEHPSQIKSSLSLVNSRRINSYPALVGSKSYEFTLLDRENPHGACAHHLLALEFHRISSSSFLLSSISVVLSSWTSLSLTSYVRRHTDTYVPTYVYINSHIHVYIYTRTQRHKDHQCMRQ